ncbi:helix-turn-helix transcriptional regulator [Parapedobacter tibetensis]|uniref:helix-turn-helix transcriptional regulator n=1 Tax=Parapedobacter tibetensis TaxID=2972951 RepID=UPI00214D49B5|nr:helix-turn-helix transcriptional regulator [Parapedobacter tibetensis]
MKKNQVPQDDGSLAKKNISELCYAVDENGRYTTVHSTGWEAKTLALNESLQLIEERIADTGHAVLAGKVSPIAYYMELHRMDVALLASYVGIHRWFVKRHFHPKRFLKLKEKTLQKYADVFGITIEQLKAPVPNPNT